MPPQEAGLSPDSVGNDRSTRAPLAKPRMNFASSDISSGVHGGSHVSSTSTSSTPGTAARRVVDALLDHRPGGAAHRRRLWIDLHLRPRPRRRRAARARRCPSRAPGLDPAQRLRDIFFRGDMRTGSQQPDLLASFAREEVDPVHEPHPVAARAHDERVRRALSVRKRTPRRRSPFETPVAATITSLGARSSIVKTRSTSSIPCSGRARSRSRSSARAAPGSRRRGSEARPPQDRLSRAADPDREVVVRPADRCGDGGGHVAVLDQLDAGACGADLLDQVVMARPVEDDRRHVFDVPAEGLRDRLDILGRPGA